MNRWQLTEVKAIAVGAVMLCAASAWANTAGQKCNFLRVKAWKQYVACVDAQVARDYSGALSDEFAAFAKCRHAYFMQWAAFQHNSSLAQTICVGARFTPITAGQDAGETFRDNFTMLQWEFKSEHEIRNFHDVRNTDNWSYFPPAAQGTVFQNFLLTLNSPPSCFTGNCDWRVPTLAELQTLLLDFPCRGDGEGARCSCATSPCVDPAVDLTMSDFYWSYTQYLPSGFLAWGVDFGTGAISTQPMTNLKFLRVVRGGL